MASGAVHNTVSVMAAGCVMVAAPVSGVPFGAAALGAAGCLLGMFLTPDLDQEGYNKVENTLRKSRNPFVSMLGNLYIIFWYPYAIVIPHRSPLSHMPIVGTSLRLLYMLIGMTIFLGVAGVAIPAAHAAVPQMWAWFSSSFEQMFPLYLGLALSDTLHWFFDLGWFRILTRITGVKL